MPKPTVEIPLETLEALCRDIEAYKAADPADDEEWTKILDTLDHIHERLDALLKLKIEQEES